MHPLRFLAALPAVLLFAAALSLAQDGSQPDLARAGDGAYLVDGQGHALYLYLHDRQGDSTCTDRCAENWPPVTVEGDPVLGDRLIDAHVGTIEREDGTQQLTYNGWPLYRYAFDDEAGDTFGHGLGDVFYLVSPAGTRIEGDVPEDRAEAQAQADGEEAEGGEGAEGEDANGADGAGEGQLADLPRMEEGQQVYTANCSVCHGAEGQGGVGPALAGNSLLDQTGTVVTTILFGRPNHGMPPFEDQLDDEEVAAVATYIRNAWGNDFGPVTPEEVSERR